MDLSLSGRHAVVTGAGRGIGLAITAALAAEGAFVTAGSLGITDELQALVGRGNVNAIAVDLSTADGPARLVDTAVAGGPLDIVVNNVGAAPVRLDGFEAVTDEDWHTTWNLTFLAAVRTTRAALPALRAAGGGVVVSVCSVNSFLPDPSVIDYSAAKAALANFSKALSKEVGRPPHPSQHGQPWTGPDEPLARRRRRRGHGRRATRRRSASGRRRPGVRRSHRPLHRAGRGRRRRAVPRQQPRPQYHRSRHRHRRRPRHDPLTA